MKKLIAWILCLSMVFSLCACTGTSGETTPTTLPATEPTVPPTTTEPAPTASEIFNTAAEKVLAAENLLLNYTIDTLMTAGGDVYEETETVSLSLSGVGTEEFLASATRKLAWGENYETEVVEYFSADTFYTKLGTAGASSFMTAEEYVDRFLPLVILTPDLYTSVEFTDDTTIAFSGAVDAEPWFAWERRTLVEASGTAVVDASGNLNDCTYHAIFTQDGLTYEITISLRALTGPVDVTIPSETANYTVVDNADAIIPYERAIGLTLQARDVSAYTSDMIFIEAAGAALTTETGIYTYGSGKELKGKFTTDISLMDYSTNSEAFSQSQEEIFKNNTYSVSTNGGVAQVNRGVTADLVEMSIESHLTNNIPFYDSLATLNIVNLGAVSLLEFTFTDEVSSQYTTSLCGKLLTDPNVLNDLASDYRTEKSGGFIGIDNLTGLPTGLGITYEGIHTIDGDECRLMYEVATEYTFGTGAGYEEVMDEPLPPVEPENKATPLLYHVTGENGEEMWLFGTIHIGDERMAFLPQELLDAFNASDALAVEYDSEAFDEQLEDDPDLMEKIQEYYFYTDGSKTADHITEEGLYETAVQLLKATGTYYSSMEYMKPSILANFIDNAYKDLGRSLSNTYGADNQLMEMAREQDKEILSVESAEFQIDMLTSYSDELQELLLEESVEGNPFSYIDSVQNLYEMWCSGDEAALIEYLAEDEEDLEEMTEEERKLYEEYWNAMSSDRNIDMLEVAKGYLDSGDVVFFAVGLAHLLAEDGLVNALREAGYTVELVTYN